MIREGRPEDFLTARQIAKDCNFNGWANNSFDLWAQRPGSIFLVAEEKGEIIGFLLSRTIFDEAELLVIAVDQKYRGRGYGTGLVDLFNRRLQIKEITKVFLEVDTGNEAALRLYKDQGYKIIGTRMNYYDGNRDAYVMELNFENTRN